MSGHFWLQSRWSLIQPAARLLRAHTQRCGQCVSRLRASAPKIRKGHGPHQLAWAARASSSPLMLRCTCTATQLLEYRLRTSLARRRSCSNPKFDNPLPSPPLGRRSGCNPSFCQRRRVSALTQLPSPAPVRCSDATFYGCLLARLVKTWENTTIIK